MSVYEGVTHFSHAQLHDPTWNYVVLGFAIVFESFSFYFAYKAFRKEMSGQGVFETIRASKDPTTFTVLFEDTAALLGLVVALLGIFLGHQLNNPYLNGVASIVIGVILAVVAGFLAFESKGLLIGEGVDPRVLASIRSLAGADPPVDEIRKSLTMHFSPNEVLLTLDIRFKKYLTARKSQPQSSDWRRRFEISTRKYNTSSSKPSL